MKVCFDIRIPCSAFYNLDVFFKSEYLHIPGVSVCAIQIKLEIHGVINL